MPQPIPFGRYLLLERVDLGGTAEVFVARVREGEGAGALVALKRLLPHLAEDPVQVARFQAEARIGSRLRHPAIAAVLDAGSHRGCHFLAVEWLPGKDLRAVLAGLAAGGGRMPLEISALVGLRLLEALDHAHSAPAAAGSPPGVAHRDVCPRNVRLSYAGEVKLLDFGSAGSAAPAGSGDPGPRGRRAYQAPELRAGGPGDARSDVFAAGAVLEEILGGAGAPPALGRLVAAALAPDPGSRPSAGEMAGALRPLAGTEEQLSAWLCRLFPGDAGRERERLLGEERT